MVSNGVLFFSAPWYLSSNFSLIFSSLWGCIPTCDFTSFTAAIMRLLLAIFSSATESESAGLTVKVAGASFIFPIRLVIKC